MLFNKFVGVLTCGISNGFGNKMEIQVNNSNKRIG